MKQRLNIRKLWPWRMRSRLYRMSRLEQLAVLLLTVLGVFMLLPIFYILNHAFKPYHELFLFPPNIFVREISWQNFIELGSVTSSVSIPMSRYLFNSILVAVLSVIIVTGVSALCAYPLSKHKFPGHQAVFALIMLTLLFAPETVAIPRYLVVSNLGIMNTYFGHVLPMVAVPVGVFLMKQFIDQLPNELLEAARLDGATEFGTFLRVVLPVCMPAVATICIISFQNAWMNTEASALFMQDEGMKTFPFFVQTLTANMTNTVARQGAAAAAALIVFLPNLIIFLLFQRKVIATMAHSGIK